MRSARRIAIVGALVLPGAGGLAGAPSAGAAHALRCGAPSAARGVQLQTARVTRFADRPMPRRCVGRVHRF